MIQRSLQILGDQTEASLRKAVVGTAFTVLVMMLATWVAIYRLQVPMRTDPERQFRL